MKDQAHRTLDRLNRLEKEVEYLEYILEEESDLKLERGLSRMKDRIKDAQYDQFGILSEISLRQQQTA